MTLVVMPRRPLTPRQRDVLQAAAEGLTNVEIGKRLYIAPDTVKGHLDAIYLNLGVRRVGAIAVALREGWIT